MLEVQVEEADAYLLLRPEGELDAYTVNAFREVLARSVGADRVVVDLSSVPFMDSAGLGALIGGIRRIREADAEITVVSSRPALTRLLHTTGFDRIVPIVESIEEAEETFDLPRTAAGTVPTSSAAAVAAAPEGPSSTRELVPGSGEYPDLLLDLASTQGRDLYGIFEKVVGAATRALHDGVFEADPELEALVSTNRDALRANVMLSAGEIDLAVATSLARNLSWRLIDAVIPPGELHDLGTSMVEGAAGVEPDLYDDADRLAELAAQADEVPEGTNPFEWVVEELGFMADSQTLAVGGTFTTIGMTVALGLGATGAAAALIGLAAGLIAAIVAYYAVHRHQS